MFWERSRSCCGSQGSSQTHLDISTRLLENSWGSFISGRILSFFLFLIPIVFGIFKPGSFFFFFFGLYFYSEFPFLPGLEGWGSWAQDSFKMFTSCVCRMRGRGLTILSGPTPMEQEVEVEVDGGLLMVSRPSAASPVVWASPAFLFRLVLSLALLVFPCPAVAARVSSSLSTTHHVHHFHNKHGTVPIAINRMPFLTRGGHGKIILFLLLITALSTLLKTISQMLTSDFPEPSQKVHFYTLRNFSSRS